MSRLDFDVVVAGGGPAGAAAARTLADLGVDVLLVEADGATFKVGEGLPPAARPLLFELGLDDAFEQQGHLPSMGNQSAWGSEDLHTTDFIRDPNGSGWHLDRGSFDVGLRCAAVAAGSTLWTQSRVKTCRRREGGWDVAVVSPTEAPRAVTSRYLIDATGRSAQLARRLGCRRQLTDRQVGLSVLYRARRDSDADSMTLVEAAAEGWWYTAQLPLQRRLVVYLTDHDLVAPAHQRLDDFHRRLEATLHIQARLRAGAWKETEALRPLAAGIGRLDRLHGEGWLAVGDAAVSFDPLASQGIFNALYCGLRAGQAVARALQGDLSRVHALADRLSHIFDLHLEHRHLYYLQEQRFADRPFWQRRHAR